MGFRTVSAPDVLSANFIFYSLGLEGTISVSCKTHFNKTLMHEYWNIITGFSNIAGLPQNEDKNGMNWQGH